MTKSAWSLLALLVCSLPAQATQLTFEQVRFDGHVFSASNGGVVPQDYGDRVAGFSQAVPGGTFTYGNLGEGFTPNVVITYGPQAGSASLWQDSYGDLSHIIYNNVFVPVQITLTADPGFFVKLHSFDLAGWPNTDYTINSISVFDGALNELFRKNNVYVEGDANGPGHSHLDFTSLQASTLILNVDMTNLSSYFRNVGLDNLVFSQLGEPITNAQQLEPSSAVPEPSSALLFATALLLTARHFRRNT